jgi:hypothetical protein
MNFENALVAAMVAAYDEIQGMVAADLDHHTCDEVAAAEAKEMNFEIYSYGCCDESEVWLPYWCEHDSFLHERMLLRMFQRKQHCKNHKSMSGDCFRLMYRRIEISVLDAADVASTRLQEDYFGDGSVDVAASMDFAMGIVAAFEAVGAVIGKDFDVAHILVKTVHSVEVVVSLLPTFQLEGGVIIYEMFDEMYLWYHWKTLHDDSVVFVYYSEWVIVLLVISVPRFADDPPIR